MSYNIYVVFDCYKGLDCSETISFIAKSASQRPIEKEINDVDEVEEPSFVESLVTSIKGKKVTDSEEEAVEEEVKPKKYKKK